MKILFVHQNFPGQFKHLMPSLVADGHEVRGLSISGYAATGVELIKYSPTRSTSEHIHPWASEFETKLIRGEACGASAEQMRQTGYQPDVIVGHPGWGEMLFLRDVWPTVPQLHFLEFFYSPGGADVAFDPEFTQNDWRYKARVRAKNANGLINLNVMDAAYSPTFWQRSSYPQYAQAITEVIHDGINTVDLTPNPNASLSMSGGRLILKPGMKVVTFINRNLEPYRGYHSFMRALPAMQARCPDALFVLIGGDGLSYGAKAPEGKTWKSVFLDEMKGKIDLSRVAFVGTVPYGTFKALMQISAAHVYLTYPFVLSWSMLEAMSCGAPVVGSATPPVQEVIDHGKNGLLVDFFDYEQIAWTVSEVVNKGHQYADLRANARRTVIERYELNNICLPAQKALIEKVARG